MHQYKGRWSILVAAFQILQQHAFHMQGTFNHTLQRISACQVTKSFSLTLKNSGSCRVAQVHFLWFFSRGQLQESTRVCRVSPSRECQSAKLANHEFTKDFPHWKPWDSQNKTRSESTPPIRKCLVVNDGNQAAPAPQYAAHSNRLEHLKEDLFSLRYGILELSSTATYETLNTFNFSCY